MAITSISQIDMGGKYAYSDYVKWQFDEFVELIKGKIFPMSAPMSRHQRIVGSIYREILLTSDAKTVRFLLHRLMYGYPPTMPSVNCLTTPARWCNLIFV